MIAKSVILVRMEGIPLFARSSLRTKVIDYPSCDELKKMCTFVSIRLNRFAMSHFWWLSIPVKLRGCPFQADSH